MRTGGAATKASRLILALCLVAAAVTIAAVNLSTLAHLVRLRRAEDVRRPVAPATSARAPLPDRPDVSDLLPAAPATSVHDLLPRLAARIVGGGAGRLVDLGAGVRDDDPAFPLVDAGWDALLVDGDPAQGPKMRARFPRAVVDNGYVLAGTLGGLLGRHGFDGRPLDLLKIDIDSFDCHVVAAALRVARPAIVVMEVNVKYPPHVRMAMVPGHRDGAQLPFDSEKRGHVYGCSLAYQVLDVMRPRGYELAHLDWNNAIYVDADRVRWAEEGAGRRRPDWRRAYDDGYWDRPSRDRAFAFNKALVEWRGMTLDQIFAAVQRQYLGDASHRDHHLYLGDAGAGADGDGDPPPLRHACFDGAGRLAWAGSGGRCTATEA